MTDYQIDNRLAGSPPENDEPLICCECGEEIDDNHDWNEVHGHVYCDECFLELVGEEDEE
jgi:predicted amidophosphoribosyltransferase